MSLFIQLYPHTWKLSLQILAIKNSISMKYCFFSELFKEILEIKFDELKGANI